MEDINVWVRQAAEMQLTEDEDKRLRARAMEMSRRMDELKLDFNYVIDHIEQHETRRCKSEILTNGIIFQCVLKHKHQGEHIWI